jgi:hypothetical protein
MKVALSSQTLGSSIGVVYFAPAGTEMHLGPPAPTQGPMGPRAGPPVMQPPCAADQPPIVRSAHRCAQGARLAARPAPQPAAGAHCASRVQPMAMGQPTAKPKVATTAVYSCISR